MTVSSLDLFAWLSADAVQTLGWTLIHFLWQGLALAILFQAAVPFCRTAGGRARRARVPVRGRPDARNSPVGLGHAERPETLTRAASVWRPGGPHRTDTQAKPSSNRPIP